MAEEREVLTADEAADFLRVSSKAILALAREATIPEEKVGRAWRFLLNGPPRLRPGSGPARFRAWRHESRIDMESWKEPAVGFARAQTRFAEPPRSPGRFRLDKLASYVPESPLVPLEWEASNEWAQ